MKIRFLSFIEIFLSMHTIFIATTKKKYVEFSKAKIIIIFFSLIKFDDFKDFFYKRQFRLSG